MKNVMQVALGIILAFIVLFIGASALSMFVFKTATEQMQNIQESINEKMQETTMKNKQIILLREQEAKRKQEIARKKYEAAIRKQEMKSKAYDKVKRIIEMNKKKEWGKFYEKPYQCEYPDSESMLRWCMKYNTRMKKEFNEMIYNGKIKLI